MLTDEQSALAATIGSVLDRVSGPAQVRAACDARRGFDDKLWSVLCEQVGVAALAVPERFGGVGAGVRELQVVAEELGRQVTPSPLLGSSVLATLALVHSGDDDACARLLPALADGSALAALAWTDAAGRWDPTKPAFTASDGAPASTTIPRRSGTFLLPTDAVLTGMAHYVLDGDTADTVLAVARTDTGLGLFELHGPAREHTPAMDQTRRLATVSGAAATRIGGDFGAAIVRVRDAACAVLAAEQAGAAAEALRLTVEYTKQRVQFGRPIGSFQALKHRMADLHVLVESARSAAYAAGEALDADAPDATRAALTAKIYCSQAFEAVAAEMIQLHGGIAITWEHDAHLYFKRAHSAAHLLGHPDTLLPELSEWRAPSD